MNATAGKLTTSFDFCQYLLQSHNPWIFDKKQAFRAEMSKLLAPFWV